MGFLQSVVRGRKMDNRTNINVISPFSRFTQLCFYVKNVMISYLRIMFLPVKSHKKVKWMDYHLLAFLCLIYLVKALDKAKSKFSSNCKSNFQGVKGSKCFRFS